MIVLPGRMWLPVQMSAELSKLASFPNQLSNEASQISFPKLFSNLAFQFPNQAMPRGVELELRRSFLPGCVRTVD